MSDAPTRQAAFARLALLAATGVFAAKIDAVAPHRVCVGERPSNTIIFGRLDAIGIGRLIALYGRKGAVQGCVGDRQLRSPGRGAGEGAVWVSGAHHSSTTRLIARFRALRGET